jgi:hypothetical protein
MLFVPAEFARETFGEDEDDRGEKKSSGGFPGALNP